jgi:CHAT domain-containing protein
MPFETLASQIYRELPRRPARALRMAEKGMALARRQPQPGALGRMTLCRAHALRECGRYSEALGDYDRAATLYRREGKTEESWRTTIGKIDVLDLMGRYGDAIRIARSAARYFQKTGLALWEAKVYANMGNVYQHLDRYQLALKYYRLAYPVLARERPLDGNIALFNQAGIHLSKGQPEDALKLLEACQSFFEQQHLLHLSGRAQYSLAYGKYLLGKYQDSLDHLSRAQSVFRSLRDRSFLASCYLDQTEIYLRLNRVDEAIRMATRARLRFEELKLPYELAESSTLLGMALLRKGKVKQAIRRLNEARKFFEMRKNRIKSAELDSHIALAYLKQQEPQKAQAHLNRAYRAFASHRIYSRMLSSVVYQASFPVSDRNWKQAELLLHRARPWIRKVRLPWVLLPYYQMLGKVQARLGRKTAADHLNRAIRLVEAMRSEIPAEDLRISYFQDKLEAFDILVTMSLQRGDRRGAREAFQYAERARSRALMDLLEGSLTFDPQHQKLEQTLAQLTSVRHESWRRSIGTTTASDSNLEQTLQTRILRLMREGQRLGDKEQQEAPSIEAIQRSLLPEQALIVYYIISNSVHAFVLDQTGLEAFPSIADESEVRQRAHFFYFQIERARLNPQEASPEACFQHLRWFGDHLLKPLYGKVRDKKLLTIIPHRWLHGFPFHCLMDSEGLLAERYGITYAPAASVYLHCSGATAAGDGPLLMGYADERAPWIRREIQEIRAIFPEARSYAGQNATGQRLRLQSPDAGLIHIASHGRFRADQPFFSGLLLADGWLTIPQIYQLRLKADLVTLSGCETGTNAISGGDELLGLTRGFLYAGASSMLVSLWRVADDSTAFFMKEFYSALAAGLPKWQCWQKALLHTRTHHPHPYFWGPFLLLGKP